MTYVVLHFKLNNMKNEYIKVQNKPDLVRDKKSNAILNTDIEGLNKYKQERESRLKQENLLIDFNNQKNEISEIKDQMNRIEQILTELLKQR